MLLSSLLPIIIHYSSAVTRLNLSLHSTLFATNEQDHFHLSSNHFRIPNVSLDSSTNHQSRLEDVISDYEEEKQHSRRRKGERKGEKAPWKIVKRSLDFLAAYEAFVSGDSIAFRSRRIAFRSHFSPASGGGCWRASRATRIPRRQCAFSRSRAHNGLARRGNERREARASLVPLSALRGVDVSIALSRRRRREPGGATRKGLFHASGDRFSSYEPRGNYAYAASSLLSLSLFFFLSFNLQRVLICL